MARKTDDRIPSSRTSKAAGIEIGVERLKALASRFRCGGGVARTLTDETRAALGYEALEAALELCERANRALRGKDW